MHFALIGITASRNATIEIVSLISRCLSQETNLTDRERDLWFRREKIRNCANFFEATSIPLRRLPHQFKCSFGVQYYSQMARCFLTSHSCEEPNILSWVLINAKSYFFPYLVGFKVAGISSENLESILACCLRSKKYAFSPPIKIDE